MRDQGGGREQSGETSGTGGEQRETHTAFPSVGAGQSPCTAEAGYVGSKITNNELSPSGSGGHAFEGFREENDSDISKVCYLGCRETVCNSKVQD